MAFKFKLGRRRPDPARPAKYKLIFKDYATQLPPPPASVDYSGGPSSVAPNAALAAALGNVLLNDQLGCCTCSGVGHVQDLLTGNAGNLTAVTDAQVLALYEAVGGYKPGDPSTDQGADEETVLDYLSSTGFPDGTKLSGYLQLDGTNQIEVQQAMDLFETLYFGVELPDAWLNPGPQANGFVWDVGQPDQNNGHCFVGVGYNAVGVQIDTWGMIGTVTWAAIAALCGAADGGRVVTLLTPDQIAKATGKAPNGFDFATLQADLDQLGGRGGLAP